MSRNFIALEFVKNKEEGFEIAKRKLYEFCDKTTALFLSGGSTQKPLYEDLAKELKLSVGAVGMVDERFGESFHQNSNEKMIKETGLLKYLEYNNIPFYSMLKESATRQEDSEKYDEIVRTLLYNFNKSIAILGIGPDGHIAGLPASARLWQAGIAQDKVSLVIEYNDAEGFYGQRITMTFNALEQMDQLLVLAFGENKKEALSKMFIQGLLQEIPARFFLMPNIAKKTILITDQKI